jgi:Tfp pilus assembly protein PilO
MIENKRILHGRMTRFTGAFVIPPIIGIALFLVLDLFFWPSKSSEITQYLQQSQQLHVDQQVMQQQILELRQQAKSWENASVQHQSMLAQFSVPVSAAELLNHFSQRAQETGIEIVKIEWLPELWLNDHKEVPFILRIRGHYSSIQRFFTQLTVAPPVIVFSRLSWQRLNQDSDVIDVDVAASSFAVK